MAHAVLMPKAGQTMTEGRVVTWLVKEGNSVERGDPLIEIETDKANLEVEALESGQLRKIFVGEGEVCPVLAVVGVIGSPDEQIDFDALRAEANAAAEAANKSTSEPASSQTPAAVASPAAPPTNVTSTPMAPPPVSPAVTSNVIAAAKSAAHPDGRVMASPLARRVAQERGVDLSRLHGSGPGGRILKRDVEEAPTSIELSPTGVIDLEALTHVADYPPPTPRPPTTVAITGIRAAIAGALVQSKQTIPHFYETAAIDVTAALTQRQRLISSGRKITVNDLVVRACAIALGDEPSMSCRVSPEAIDYPEDINIGIAVGSDNGLVVPVLQRAQILDLDGVARETRRLVNEARAGKLIGSGTGTFTISNLGMFGIESFSAIINPPEGAILAVGAARPEVVPYAGGLVPRAMLRVTLSCDHRAIDGLLAARFLLRLRHVLEHPEQI